jgi:hypothetical protein
MSFGRVRLCILYLGPYIAGNEVLEAVVILGFDRTTVITLIDSRFPGMNLEIVYIPPKTTKLLRRPSAKPPLER